MVGSFANKRTIISNDRTIYLPVYNLPMMQKPLPKQVLKPTLTNSPNPKPAISRSGQTILLGENIYWDLGKVPNPHMVILGTSGSGKTQTLKAIAGELYRSSSSQSIVLDFHGDQQLPGETYYPLNMASSYGINPLTINPDPEGGGPKLPDLTRSPSNPMPDLKGSIPDCW